MVNPFVFVFFAREGGEREGGEGGEVERERGRERERERGRDRKREGGERERERERETDRQRQREAQNEREREWGRGVGVEGGAKGLRAQHCIVTERKMYTRQPSLLEASRSEQTQGSKCQCKQFTINTVTTGIFD